MINILCVCVNGMGTSTILKVNVKNICREYGIDASVESCGFGEAMAYSVSTDLILTSPEWVNMLPPIQAEVVLAKNLVEVNSVRKVLLQAVREHFPDELKEHDTKQKGVNI